MKSIIERCSSNAGRGVEFRGGLGLFHRLYHMKVDNLSPNQVGKVKAKQKRRHCVYASNMTLKDLKVNCQQTIT